MAASLNSAPFRVLTKVLVVIVAVGLNFALTASSDGTFTVDYEHGTFLKDGRPFRYVSGSIHYHRVPPLLWRDRLKKMAAAGLDAIQTYIPWNFHMPTETTVDFTGWRDVVKFLRMAQDEGLYVLLRPGPFIDAEVDFGGLPWWLLKGNENVTVRSRDPVYLMAVEGWLDELLPRLRPLMYTNGGPVLMVQVENEYGSYAACDHVYLGRLYSSFRGHLGNTTLLFSTDGYLVSRLKCSVFPDIYPTVDFGTDDNMTEAFRVQRMFNGGGPLVNSEFYTGWLDHWGDKHHTVPTANVTSGLDDMLALGASVNMYMFHGGTSFAFWNGAEAASEGKDYKAEPTSYDYDAPISEAGDVTDKLLAIRQVIGKYKKLRPLPMPANNTKKAYGRVKMTKVGDIFDLQSELNSSTPKHMEAFGQGYGLALYCCKMPYDVTHGVLDLRNVRDRAQVFVNKCRVSTVTRCFDPSTLADISAVAGDDLCLLVENMGRINYGPSLNLNRKGFFPEVIYLNGKVLNTTWRITGLKEIPWDTKDFHSKRLKVIPWFWSGFHAERQNNEACYTGERDISALYRGIFRVDSPADTFLRTPGWAKGIAFVNNKVLGRYWPAVGPQATLYIPAPFLAPGENVVHLLELDQAPVQCFGGKPGGKWSSCTVFLDDKADLNGGKINNK